MVETMPNETCEECSFDASRWTRQDAIRTVEHAADLVDFVVEGLAPDRWNRRSRPDRWSIAEYVDHIRAVIEINRRGCELSIAQPDRELPPFDHPPIDPEPERHDPILLMEELRDQSQVAARFFLGVDKDDWDKALIVEGRRWTVGYDVTHLCHDLMHHLGDIAAIRHELGETVGPLVGEVAQVNASGGGVPKLPVDRGAIDFDGLAGDRQATRRHHGRPWQAICLYSAEVIEALRAEGHPIGWGSTGENLTIAGIDWSLLRAGLVVEIGGVTLRLSAPAVPCSKNKPFFADGHFLRMDHDRHPGWSRWYASVLEPGHVATGDTVRVHS